MTTERSLLFLGTLEDKPYLQRLKPFMQGHKVFVDLAPVSTVAEVEMYCKVPTRNISGVLTTSIPLLKKLVNKTNVSLDNYAGSYFKPKNIEYVFVNPLEQLMTVPYGTFLLNRFASKLVTPEKWLAPSEFKWRVVTDRNAEDSLNFLRGCDLIATDIETFKLNTAIRCIGFTGVKFVPSGIETHSFVVPFTDMFGYHLGKTICELPIPKIFQNGKYDINYLLRYNIQVSHYFWDTAALFHCWYSELPKDLGFLQAFFVRTAAYWKDLADTTDLEQYYLYNAKDTWATAMAFLAWQKEAPEWARKNYSMEFPLQFPCILSEMTGIARDQDKIMEARKELDAQIDLKNARIAKITGKSDFNVNSPLQMKALLKALGCNTLLGADDTALAKAAYAHPLNGAIIDIIRGIPKSDEPEFMGIRAMRKAKSTYLRIESDSDGKDTGGSKEFKGRSLYALNPHGTDSGRLASKAHHFWCGFNIQNQPAGKLIKQTYVADPDFLFGEADLEQAETRGTAYITGDSNLLKAVNSDKDFHSTNAAAFFGILYESIYNTATKKVLNKPLRQLAKRINHGANYNMGASVLVDTMGLKSIYEAAILLKLPRHWEAKDIANYLLQQFDKTYPIVRGAYHERIIMDIRICNRLVGATDWTRYCFSNPMANKSALNSYVAHAPQSLNAMLLNKAYLKVFYTIAMHPEHKFNFKLLAQIHDSILFQYRKGHEYLGTMVKECMEIPVEVKDISGVSRTLCVPAALKIGNAKYWSDLE